MRKRFCYACGQRTDHEALVDIYSTGGETGVIERVFLGLITMGASEAMAERRRQCQECGLVTKK